MAPPPLLAYLLKRHNSGTSTIDFPLIVTVSALLALLLWIGQKRNRITITHKFQSIFTGFKQTFLSSSSHEIKTRSHLSSNPVDLPSHSSTVQTAADYQARTILFNTAYPVQLISRPVSMPHRVPLSTSHLVLSSHESFTPLSSISSAESSLSSSLSSTPRTRITIDTVRVSRSSSCGSESSLSSLSSCSSVSGSRSGGGELQPPSRSASSPTPMTTGWRRSTRKNRNSKDSEASSGERTSEDLRVVRRRSHAEAEAE